MTQQIIEKAFEIVNTLWPLFSGAFYWLGIGAIAWGIGSIIGFFGYDDFRRGYQDGHEVIWFGPIALVMVIVGIVELIKDKRRPNTGSKRQGPADEKSK